MCKTLYVSDLDGTLLTSGQTVSDFTAGAINTLIDSGMIFSYATARSYITAAKVTNTLKLRHPVAIYNGTYIIDGASGNKIESCAFSDFEAKQILDALINEEIYPIVYSYIDGREKFSYLTSEENERMLKFNRTRRGDVRENPVCDIKELYSGEIFHFTCIDCEEKLAKAACLLMDKYYVISHRDIYSLEPWMEIQPLYASKASAVLRLKKLLGCEKIVCFGDSVNDIPMFEIADESYATEGAAEELKKIATDIIGSNDADGVAKWLLDNFPLKLR